MRHKLATQALKHLSLKIGLLWVGTNVLGNPVGETPDVTTVDRATELIRTYFRARAAYDVGDYLATIKIATEDEA